MFLLAVVLIFFPYYNVTYDKRAVALVADSKGNAYTTSLSIIGGGGLPDYYLNKVDAGGHLVYRVQVNNSFGGVAATPDDQGNLYAAITGYKSGACCLIWHYAIKLDAFGNLVYQLLLRLSVGSTVSAPAIGTDGSAYFTGSGEPAAPGDPPMTTPGAWVTDAGAARNHENAQVIKISPAGDHIVYSTFLDNAPHPDPNGYTLIPTPAVCPSQWTQPVPRMLWDLPVIQAFP